MELPVPNNSLWIQVSAEGIPSAVFEGTLEQFKDCFFSNACPYSIDSWAEENGFVAEFFHFGNVLETFEEYYNYVESFWHD